MRPVPKLYKMHFGFGEKYPKELQYLTEDGKHHGFDYLTPIGTPGSSGVDGIVNHLGSLRGYGLCLIVKFWSGRFLQKKEYRALIAHLASISESLRVGSKLRKTENCYFTGDSGMAKGHPHLHYEVQVRTKRGWIAVNPSFAVGDA